MSYGTDQCESREPIGHTITSAKTGEPVTLHARCQRRSGHDGRHENGSGKWDDDGNVWSWGRKVVHVS